MPILSQAFIIVGWKPATRKSSILQLWALTEQSTGKYFELSPVMPCSDYAKIRVKYSDFFSQEQGGGGSAPPPPHFI